MTRKGNKRKPPSRVRYEAAHPTVSVRVSRALRDKLEEIKALTGKSNAEIVRETLEAQIKVDEAYHRGFGDGLKRGEEEGYDRGLREGRSHGESEGYKRGLSEGAATIRSQLTYMITLRCRECGGRKILENDEPA